MARQGAERVRASRAAALALLAVLAVAVVLLAGGALAVDEEEPNDSRANATSLASFGSYVVDGQTNATNDTLDYFKVQLTQAAVVDVSLTANWACQASECENISALDSNGTVIISPFGNPMEGDGAYFSGIAGQTFYLRVAAGDPGGLYSFSVDIYPFDYTNGETVGIRDAIQSTAILADAYAETHSTFAPYVLSYEGEGTLYGYALLVEILNVGPHELEIELPAGLMWVPQDDAFTEFVVTRDQYVTVPAWTYVADVEFIAVATSPYRAVPGDPLVPGSDVIYDPGGMATDELRAITDETNSRNYAHEAELIAVWAWTAGQNEHDFDTHGASTASYNTAVQILDRVDIHTAINPTRPWYLFGLFGSSFDWFLWCFIFLFFLLPILVGVVQALRALRLRHFVIDAAYSQAHRASRRRDQVRIEREESRRARERYRQEIREQMARRPPTPRVAIPPPPPPPPRPKPSLAPEPVRPQPPPQPTEAPPPQAQPAQAQPAQAQPAQPQPPQPAPKPSFPEPEVPTPPPQTPLGQFLAMDGMENFDLDKLNELDYNAVLAAAVSTKTTAAQTAEKTAALLKRLKEDVDDPDTIDDILRNRMVQWYRESPDDDQWGEHVSVAWWGLTAQSRAEGGRKRASLERRLENLHYACDSRGKWFKPKPPGDRDEERSKGRGAEGAYLDPVELKAEVVQAVLDDLTAHPRTGPEGVVPLPRLSELGARLSPLRVNRALAEMFKADPRGPFVILHPSRYPDVGVTAIRPPSAAARGGAMAYEVVLQAPPGAGAGSGPAGARAASGAPALLDISAAVWEREDMDEPRWSAVLDEAAHRRERLDPPPGGYRKLPSYFALRKLLLSSTEACDTFIGVKWRGKPSALPLLAELLRDGSVTPEFQTDRDYLEAELGDLDRGDPEWRSPDGTWKVDASRTVRREPAGDGLVKYTL